jgi:hypothetical protein
MLQAGSSRVRFPMRSLKFFIHLILPAAIWLAVVLVSVVAGTCLPSLCQKNGRGADHRKYGSFIVACVHVAGVA